MALAHCATAADEIGFAATAEQDGPELAEVSLPQCLHER